MVPGIELVAGYLLAWAVEKARHVGRRADGEVDRVLDAGMDRLHDLVSDKLGDDPALAALEREAANGVNNGRTQQRVQLAVEDAADADAAFADRLRTALRELSVAGGASVLHQQVMAFGNAQQAVLGQGTQTNTFGTRSPL
ncbi:chromosome partitioning protein [Micromonospora chokoriensis]